LKTD
jgi:Zn-dependent M32 family carboxypeptidase